MAEKKPKRAATKKRLTTIKKYKEIFETEAGKEVLKDLIRHAGLLRPNFSIENPHVTSFNEGSRSVVCYILENLNIDEGQFIKMAEQNYKEEHNIFK